MKFLTILLPLQWSLCFAGNDIIFINGFEPEPPTCVQSTLFNDNFNTADQLNWAAMWQESGNSIELAEIVNNEGRLIPLASNSPYSLARIFHPLENAIDAEATFSLTFENASSQGIGFYLRSNGGFLVNTTPMGQGYGVFIERFSGNQSRLGLWYEHDGIESAFIRQPLMPSGSPYDFIDEVKYNVRFQVYQEDVNNTRIRAKIWQDGTIEPSLWGVSVLDNYIPLQNTAGGTVVDSYNSQSNGTITDAIRIDDIEIKNLCNPLLNFSTPIVIASGFQFAEGPVWKDNAILFSDIDANSIFQWQEGNGITLFNATSGNSNGLVVNTNNSLIAAEHGNRQISITDINGTSTLVGDYQGNLFNSPNDLVISNTGVIYFTDPDYGLDGRPREIAFNGVYKLHPQDGLSVQYQGDANANKPNGIILSKNQDRLFWSDTQTGIIHQMEVAADGELSNLSDFATGLTIPDGMCIDNSGNIYIATWNSAIEVFTENGDYWGALSMPENPITNCTFGGANNETLYITGRNNLYQTN